MKRTREHVLEDESKQALRSFLPPEWIFREKPHDYGIDIEIEIVEGEEFTNKVLWVQLKSTGDMKKGKVSYQMKTDHLKYYENCHLPVIILYWIKSENTFYYVFSQKYINEVLSLNKPQWREQKTVSVVFDSRLETPDDLKFVATEGYFYVLRKKLSIGPKTSAYYWLDGIPQSDNEELKECTLKALLFLLSSDYPAAIDELENTLRVCTPSPAEKMSILTNLGSAYYSLCQYDDALRYYRAVFELAKKVNREDAIEGISVAFGNIGLVYYEKGDLNKALEYHQKALEIHREIGYRHGEASDLGNIGLIYKDKKELDEALKYHQRALEIAREIGYKRCEAVQLGNIGLIYSGKGELDEALEYHKEALRIDKDIGYRQGEAIQLKNIGLILRFSGNSTDALAYLNQSLDIFEEIGMKEKAELVSNLILEICLEGS